MGGSFETSGGVSRYSGGREIDEMEWKCFAQAGELGGDVIGAKRSIGTGLVVVSLALAIFLESDEGKDSGNIRLFLFLLEPGDAFAGLLCLGVGENVDGGAVFGAKAVVGCAGVSGKVDGDEQVLGSDRRIKSNENGF